MPNLPFTLSLSLLSACTAAYALPAIPTVADEVALLRAQGPAGLDSLLARWDHLDSGPERDALADEIDQVAQQRYATTSRMYWYTDLAAATAAAQQRRVPILELRLLGRLDQELSCANSRLFRATLYANTELSKFLREHFVLYWSTERPVPKVTIDFGDGRTIHTTAVGNSAHFIRDERGGIVDLLPGVYAPGPFRAELEKTLALVATLDASNGDHRRAQIREYHALRAQQSRTTWTTMFATRSFRLQIDRTLKDKSAVEQAQIRTISKAYIEVPQLKGIGADPGKLADDETAAWAKIGELAWPTSDAAPVLDKASRQLVLALHDAGPVKSTTAELTALIPRFEQHLLADSALDQFKLRLQVHDYLASKRERIELAALDRWLYAEVFKTPITDRWLGLLPRTDVTGLPGDGATAP
ncbi:hypothetical protein BH11MYX3_BH11MYX3_22350 [soil metagenome]